jgi:rare lipoprotein A
MGKTLFAALALVAAACAPAVSAAPPVSDSVVSEVQTGTATYYSSRFEGRRTAAGDTFRNDALTAAHPDLPFGTIVRVTNLAKGHFVDVRITDRLPSKRAIIDLTRKAASQLNMLQAGRVKVSVKVLEWGRGRTEAALRAAQGRPVVLSATPIPPAAAPVLLTAAATDVLVAVATD